jgi:hypothetical protein
LILFLDLDVSLFLRYNNVRSGADVLSAIMKGWLKAARNNLNLKMPKESFKRKTSKHRKKKKRKNKNKTKSRSADDHDEKKSIRGICDTGEGVSSISIVEEEASSSPTRTTKNWSGKMMNGTELVEKSRDIGGDGKSEEDLVDAFDETNLDSGSSTKKQYQQMKASPSKMGALFQYDRLGSISDKEEITATGNVEGVIPFTFLCSINGHVMKNPVTSPNGVSFEKETIELWIKDSVSWYSSMCSNVYLKRK